MIAPLTHDMEPYHPHLQDGVLLGLERLQLLDVGGIAAVLTPQLHDLLLSLHPPCRELLGARLHMLLQGHLLLLDPGDIRIEPFVRGCENMCIRGGLGEGRGCDVSILKETLGFMKSSGNTYHVMLHLPHSSSLLCLSFCIIMNSLSFLLTSLNRSSYWEIFSL